MLRDAVRDAAEAWVRAALALATARAGFRRTETDTWVRANEHRFRRITWNRLVYDPNDVARSFVTREFQALRVAAIQDPQLGPLWNRFVGTERGFGTTFNENRLSSLFLPVDNDPTRPKEQLEFDEAQFDSDIESLRRFAVAERVSFRYVYPLIGFQADHPIPISAGISIRHMSDDEIVNGLHWGLLPTHLNQYREHTSAPHSCFAVVREVEEPQISLAQQPQVGAGNDPYSNDRVLIEECLGIATVGDVRVCSTMHYSPSGWPYSVRSVFQPTTVSDEHQRHRIARVGQAEFPLFSAAWRALVGAWPGFTLASRRLYQSSMRENAIDSLLDDMIAAEAVLLPRMQDELSYRLASNAAQYLGGNDVNERRRLFDFYKDAYSARSKIAHGENPDRLALRLDGVNVGLRQFELAFRESLRALMRRMIENEESAAPIEWVDRVIGPRH
jgi:hypothetical protein